VGYTGGVDLRGGGPRSLMSMLRIPYPGGITLGDRWLWGAKWAVVEIGFAGSPIGRVKSRLRSLASTTMEVATLKMVSRLKYDSWSTTSSARAMEAANIPRET
jgi:hypothetical protein